MVRFYVALSLGIFSKEKTPANPHINNAHQCVLLVESIMFLWKNGVSLNMTLLYVQTTIFPTIN